MHVRGLGWLSNNISVNIYLFYRAPITLLKVNKSFTVVLFKYVDFIDIFFGKFYNQVLREYQNY